MQTLKANQKDKGHHGDHNSFTFSFHHIQLDTTVTYSLDADITIHINKSISYSIEKSIRHSIKYFGAYSPHLQLNKWEKGGLYTYWNNELHIALCIYTPYLLFIVPIGIKAPSLLTSITFHTKLIRILNAHTHINFFKYQNSSTELS